MDKNVSCNCFEKVLTLILKTQQLESTIDELKTQIKKDSKSYISTEMMQPNEALKIAGKELKEEMKKAIDCGFPPVGIAPVVRGVKVEEVVDLAVNNFHDSTPMLKLWDLVWDNVFSIKQCHVEMT